MDVMTCMSITDFHLLGLWIIVFNATFNNISAYLSGQFFVLEETGVQGEKHLRVDIVRM
jgi:hypothetical protein